MWGICKLFLETGMSRLLTDQYYKCGAKQHSNQSKNTPHQHDTTSSKTQKKN